MSIAVAGFDIHRSQITFDSLDTETGEPASGSRTQISQGVRGALGEQAIRPRNHSPPTQPAAARGRAEAQSSDNREKGVERRAAPVSPSTQPLRPGVSPLALER
jgi:hypothetical protein